MISKQKRSIMQMCAVGAALATVVSCGKKSSDDETTTTSSGLSASAVSLSALPDLSKAMKSSSGTSLADLFAVAGTAPLMTELADTATSSGSCKKWDKMFFNCAVSEVNAASSASATQRKALERGEAICRNAAETANIMREFGGGSMCYMSNVPKLSTATVTVSQEGAGITASSYADMMKPTDKAKLVKVMPTVNGSKQQDIFIDIPAASGSSLEFKLTYCASGEKQGEESILVDVNSGKMITKNTYSHTQGGFSNLMTRTATLYIKKSGDDIAFDLTKDRTVEGSAKFQGSWGSNTNNYKISLDKDNYLTNMNYATQTFSHGGQTQTGTQKIWAKTLISGDSGIALRMPEMGMAMVFTQGSNTFSPSGAVEWQTDTYADTTSSSLYTQAKAYAWGDSVFQSAPTAPTISLAAADCARTPDAIVSFKMDSTEGATVRTKCEADPNNKLQDMYQLCNNSDIQSARQKGFQAPQQ
jgi:hypothetical protein